MEDMARLALVEQNVRDVEKFSKILYELLRHINYILENPYDYELRPIKSEVLMKLLEYEAFVDYLTSIGFRLAGKENEYTYPKENTLSKLRMAQAAIERKIYFCCGSLNHSEVKVKSGHNQPQAKRPKFTPAKVLTHFHRDQIKDVIKKCQVKNIRNWRECMTRCMDLEEAIEVCQNRPKWRSIFSADPSGKKNTNNALLLRIESMFNGMIKYEDEDLQELAREHIPMVTLQLMALDRVREHQRKIKIGEVKGHDLPFDMALLMELLGWFKYKFFSWVDRPACETCGGSTVLVRNDLTDTGTETCRVEIYKCLVCGGGAQFVRHNELRALLRTRRGRCGEWANCFTLLCRALGYDTRYVYDTTDHVWCEVYDYDSGAWLHVDPCEGKLDTPLMYCHGWGKKISYVIALSRDDLQDVTWRYTMNHKEVLKSRVVCSERELVEGIMLLRQHRQRQVSLPRRRHLATRCLQELVHLMVERKPSDYESHGRISGSKEWRSERGESGTKRGHVFIFNDPGNHSVEYYPTSDKYRMVSNGTSREIVSWEAGVFECENMMRKVESDWQMVYLAREEGESTGSISWQLATEGDHYFSSITVKLTSMLYEDGHIEWTIAFDDEDSAPAKFGEVEATFSRRFVRCSVRARLRGGRGSAAYQHAQLFRASLRHDPPALHLRAALF